VYEGTIVKHRAVLGTGSILNRSIPVYDLVRDAVYTAGEKSPLVIPEKPSSFPARVPSHIPSAQDMASACNAPSSSNTATPKPTPVSSSKIFSGNRPSTIPQSRASRNSWLAGVVGVTRRQACRNISRK